MRAYFLKAAVRGRIYKVNVSSKEAVKDKEVINIVFLEIYIAVANASDYKIKMLKYLLVAVLVFAVMADDQCPTSLLGRCEKDIELGTS